MAQSLTSLRRIPAVVRASINQGSGVVGSFIDPEWVLHYIEAGQWEFVVGSHFYPIAAGDMVLLPPHLLHIVRPVSGKRLIQQVVHFELLDGPFQFSGLPYAVCLPTPVRRRVRTLFAMLQDEWKAQRQQGLSTANGLVVAMLGIYASHARQPYPASSGEVGNWRNVENAIRCIQNEYACRDLTLADVSRAARLSLNHFCRVFKTSTGISTMHYLAHYRIQKAEELLLNSSFNCSEIAQAVGFDSVHHLSHLFRKMKGMPPTAYRELYGA